MVNPGGATVIKGTSPTHKRKDHHRWSAVLIGQHRAAMWFGCSSRRCQEDDGDEENLLIADVW
jgi:hypothetical protein